MLLFLHTLANYLITTTFPAGWCPILIKQVPLAGMVFTRLMHIHILVSNFSHLTILIFEPKTQYVKVLTSTGSIVDVLQKYIGFSTPPRESFQPSANQLNPKTNGSKLFAPAFCFLRQPPVDKITAWPCVISNQNYNRYKIAIASTTSRRP